MCSCVHERLRLIKKCVIYNVLQLHLCKQGLRGSFISEEGDVYFKQGCSLGCSLSSDGTEMVLNTHLSILTIFLVSNNIMNHFHQQ